MGEQVIEISTGVFRLLQKRAPAYVSWSDERPGSTQRILVEDDVYREFIDRAIAKRKTLNQVIAETCVRSDGGVNPEVPHLPQRIRRYG
jgi:nicotinic acid phosphoribosyltransferase